MSEKLDLLKFFMVNGTKEYSAKELSKFFNISTKTIYLYLKEFRDANFIKATNKHIPQKYMFNELFNVLLQNLPKNL